MHLTAATFAALKLLFAVLGLLALAGAPVLALAAVGPSEPGRRIAARPDATAPAAVPVRIGARTFLVPAELLAAPARGDGSDERAFLLHARLPGLPPLSHALVLVRDGARVEPLAAALHLAAPDADPEAAPMTGLDLRRVDAGGGREAFVDAAGGAVRRLILSDAPEAAGSLPLCDHAFDHKSMRVEVSYGREHLHAWAAIERAVRRFLDHSEQPASVPSRMG